MSEVVAQLLASHAGRVEAFFRDVDNALGPRIPQRLRESIKHSLLAPGKRVRPALVYEWCQACGGKLENATAAAAAIELIHTFSLVHDDLPCMDDDDLRRGRPTNHKVFGEAMAVLAGDAMTTIAFQLLADSYEPALAVELVQQLAEATGPIGMIGGQVLDMQSEGQTLDAEGLADIHRRKTGALIMCSCAAGALVAGAETDAARAYGEHLGLAFQIADDLLDVSASTEELGKTAGKDVAAGKNTYPALLGLDEARRRAREEADAAVAALDGFGPAADGLRHLARYTVERTR